MPGILSGVLSLVTGKASLLLVKAVATTSWLLSTLWKTTAVFLATVWETVVGGLAAVFNYLTGVVVALSLLLMAVGLRLLGIDDTYARLGGTREPTDPSSTDPVETALDVSTEAVTDDSGSFSRRAFVEATGMSPAEFVHLYVRRSGGRVRQTTLNACLPWSKSTVSRLLDTLERDEVMVRVESGRENLVCVPDAIPDSDDNDE